jgi:hypothetical protein
MITPSIDGVSSTTPIHQLSTQDGTIPVAEILPTQDSPEINPQTPAQEAAEKNDERDKIRNPFPIKSLPGPIRALVQAIVNNGHSEDKAGILALPMLGAVAAALGQGVVAQGREYIQHPNLYFYCNIDSGSIKSVAIDYAVAPIYAKQAQLLEDFNTNLKPDLLRKRYPQKTGQKMKTTRTSSKRYTERYQRQRRDCDRRYFASKTSPLRR